MASMRDSKLSSKKNMNQMETLENISNKIFIKKPQNFDISRNL